MGGVVLVVLILVLLSRSRSSSTSSRGTISISRAFAVWFWKFVLLNAVSVAFAVIGWPWQILIAPAFVVVLAPSLVLQALVVPLRMPRVSYWTARFLGPVGVMKEFGAGAAMYGALTLAHHGPSPAAMAWLEQKIRSSKSTRGAGVVAAGLLAALRGDRRRARSLLLVADNLPRRWIPRAGRTVARDWLVTDAARVGNWREVIRLGQRGRESSRWTYAVARMAERLVRDPKAVPDWWLWLAWLIAPRRRATIVLLRRALAVPRTLLPVTEEPSEPPADLPDALGALGRSIDQRFALDGPALTRAVNAVDAALDLPETRARIEQRLLALGARSDAESIAFGFRKRLIELLVPVLEQSPALAAGGGPIMEQAVERVRSRLIGDVEAQCKDYWERQKNENALDPLAEWQTWALTRDAADRLVQLVPTAVPTVFQTMYVRVCNFAVFQHNKYRRLALANEMYSWLAHHCQNDAAATQLLRKNMAASLD